MKAFEINSKKTVLFYLHGLRGHAFAQKAALQHMVRNMGISMVSLELPGHGQDSFEEHCMVPKFPMVVDLIVNEVKRRSVDVEQIFMMGYSFGGTLMLLAAEKLIQDAEFDAKVAGFVGVSTAFDVGHNVPKWQLALVSIIAPLSRFLYRRIPDWSRFVTIREMNVELISTDPAVQKSISEDELVYKGRIPLNTSAQVYKSGLKAEKRLKKMTLPSLLLHSLDDAIALAPQPNNFGTNVDLRLFKKLRHNCIDGLSREVVIARRAISEFIVQKL